MQTHFFSPLRERSTVPSIAGNTSPSALGRSYRTAFRTRAGSTRNLICNTNRKRPTLMKNLYVGNLPHSTTEPELRGLFEAHGAVEKVSIVTDRETGRARGSAFVAT